jgi:hypothetical protein
VQVGKAISLITIAVCVLLCGCRDNPTMIWSEESRSLDGLWLARAHTDQYSGPGNAGLYTMVELKRLNGPKKVTEILEFDFQTATPDRATIKMNWFTPTHLNVTYGGDANLDFQVVKCAGIDISVQDLSADTTTGKNSK